MEPPAGTRPYRSHKFPACTACRSRKIRCHFDQAAAQCTLCREKGWQCVTASPAPNSQKRVRSTPGEEGRPAKRNERSPGLTDTGLPSNSVRAANRTANRTTHQTHQTHQTSATNAEAAAEIAQPLDHPSTESSVIVGPVLVEDIQILGPYLSKETTDKQTPTGIQDTASGPSRNPLLYLSVPRRRRGLQPAKDPGSRQKEILSQLMGPFTQDLIDLYFEYAHPNFPILDELAIKKHGASGVSPTLWCYILMNSALYWSRSSRLRKHPRPDLTYICNNGVAALQEDYMEPSVSTILSSVLDMIGRPVNSIVGNIINEGRTLALAQTFGMNRNPTHSGWSDQERKLRIRTWWAVLINNKLSCLAHGTPPTTSKKHYDVPVPTLTELLTPGSQDAVRVQGAEHFIQLCNLCDILGETLSLSHDIRPLNDTVQRDLRRLECDLDQWEVNLPSHLVNPLEEGKSQGACNLHFFFLANKLTLARTSLRAASDPQRPDISSEHFRYRLAVLRSSAREIADFVSALTSQHLAGYWLSYTAHVLALSAMILLRCTIETTESATRESCKQSLEALRKRLRAAREVDDWDLADIFLNQCDEPISRVIEKLDNPAPPSTSSQPAEGQTQPDTTMNTTSFPPLEQDFAFDLASHAGLGSDLNLPFETFGYPFENMWNLFDESNLGGF